MTVASFHSCGRHCDSRVRLYSAVRDAASAPDICRRILLDILPAVDFRTLRLDRAWNTSLTDRDWNVKTSGGRGLGVSLLLSSTEGRAWLCWAN